MTPIHLVHQYFDEGLDAVQEDLLFSALNTDPQLRREFNEHLRLHSFVQNDLRSITPPAAVTAALFTGLGLTAPSALAASTAATPAAASTSAPVVGSAVWHALRSAAPYLATSLFSIVATSVFFISTYTQQSTADLTATSSPAAASVRQHETAPVATRERADSPTPSSAFRQADAARSVAATPVAVGDAAETVAPQPEASTTENFLTETQPAPVPVEQLHTVRTASVADAAGLVEVRTPAASMAFIDLNDVEEAQTDLNAEATEEAAHVSARPSIVPVAFVEPQLASVDTKGRFFFVYNSDGAFLTNLVFEMRLLNSRSHPSVDLPYNSHDLFKDMAISAVYKVSDLHAFGLEYGRETFGQEFQMMNPATSLAEKEPIRVVYDPPVPWIPSVVQRNKMLDWYGAVWKLSLPDLGILHFVYPYTRTVLGATKLGPLAKVRFGLEMYPTNYSMFNLGLEGTMLNYVVEGSWYKTYKLGVTFGVAVGF